MRHIAFFSLLFSSIVSQETVSPREIAQELTEAHKKYARAKEMFNPWYTGPLITPAPALLPPGQVNFQPYLFVEGTFASFDSKRKSISLKDNRYSYELMPVLLIGLTDSVDFTIIPSFTYNTQNGKSGGGFNDIATTFSFLILQEGLYVPVMSFSVSLSYPTGKYKNLSVNGLGLNSTGRGAYQAQFGLGIGKLLWWFVEHPLNLRSFVGYTFSTKAKVQGFNTYGGDLKTKGTVHPGNAFTSEVGIEVSLKKNWVFALDIVYTGQNQTKFNGRSSAPVGGGYSDNLSIAPALEYLWNPNLGIIFGSQVSLYGRNSDQFTNGQLSVTYTW